MKNIFKLLFVTALYCVTSCSGMNDLHDKYLRDGETIYISIFDSFYVNPGENAVEIQYWLSDPKAKHSVIYWNLKNDSTRRDISITDTKPGVLRIENLDEGSVSFEMYNYDADYKDKSIVMSKTVSVYGDFYKSNLDNRLIRDYLYSRSTQNLTINWISAVYENAVGVEIKYLNVTGVEKDTLVDIIENTVVIPYVMEWSIIDYRTLYKPDENSIDTFYTAWQSVGIETPMPVVPSPPAGGTAGKTITLSGSFLDSSDEIWFGTVKGVITSRTATSLTALIPAGTAAGTVPLKIVYGLKETVISTVFNISAEIIPAFTNSPITAEAGKDIILTGTNLDIVDEVWFGTFKGVVKLQSLNAITVTVPSDISGTVALSVKYDNKTLIVVANFVITKPAVAMKQYQNVNIYGPTSANAGFFKLETGENVSPCDFVTQGANGHYFLLGDGSGGLQLTCTQLNNMTSKFSCNGATLANRTNGKEIRFKKRTEGLFFDAVKGGQSISLTVEGAVEAGLLLNATGSPNPLTGLNFVQVARHYPEDDERNNGADGWVHDDVFFFAVWDVNTYSAPIAGVGFVQLVNCTRDSAADKSGYITVNIWYHPK